MNYWLLTTEYPPFHGGGISTYCYQSARMFTAMGEDVTVFVPDDSIKDHEITLSEGPVRIIRFNSNRSNSGSFLGYTARLSYEFALIVRDMITPDNRPDIIEAQDYLGIACYLLQFKYLLYEELKDVPIILTLHSPAFLYLEYNRVPTYRFPEFWTCEMEKQAIKMADHLISPTRYLAEAIGAYVDLEGANLSIVRNPFYAAGHRSFPVQRNKIVYYGKLSPQKGSFELMQYFKKLWDEKFPHPLHIIGGTDIVYHPERKTMGQLVRAEYGDYIHRGLLVFHDKIDPSLLEDALKDSHVIIVPSIVDNLPYVVLEAMSLGKIVLASVQGGQKEMIDDGINGFLFDHDKPGDFESRLLTVLALSDERIHAISVAAIEKVNALYDPVEIGRQKLLLLDSIRRSHRRAGNFPFLHQESVEDPAVTVPGEPHKLSVVIPYYNMGKYISECIRSVKASAYPGIEILIIDDGSTDSESILALERLSGTEGIKIYRKPNEGLAETRNYGAGKASGEYLAFLDADDAVEPGYYQKAIRVFQSYKNVFFAGSWVTYFGDSHKKWATFMPQPPYLLVHNPVNSSGLVYKRSAFMAAGFNDKKVGYGLEDYESVINLMQHGYNGIILPEFLFRYRVRKDSMFRKITREKLLYSCKYITEKHATYYADFAAEIMNILNANGPGFLFDNPTTEIYVSSRPAASSGLRTGLIQFVKRHKLLKKIGLKIIKYFNI